MPVFFSRRFFGPVMSDRDVCQICAVRVHLAIRRRSLGSNRGMKGASELKTWLTSGWLSESFCNVVDGMEEMSSEHNCGFGFLNSQTLRQNRAVENQKCRTQMTRTSLGTNTLTRSTTMREKCGAGAHGSKANALCALAGVSGTRHRRRRRDCLWLFVRVVLS